MAKQKTTSAAARPVVHQLTPPPADGANMMAEMQKRCEDLRSWHLQATTQMAQSQKQLNQFAQDLTDQQAEIAAGQDQLEADRDKLASDRTKLANEREAFRSVQKKLEREQNELKVAQTKLKNSMKDVEEMRREIDDEWASLRSLRHAYDKLGSELDTERQRLNRRSFKLTPGNDATSKSDIRAAA